MTEKQLSFKFKRYKIGDLVKVNKKYHNINKTYGVVVELGESDYMAEHLKIHWLNYGTFWTVADKLIKMNKNEEI